MPELLKVGDPAPDFTLESVDGPLHLKDVLSQSAVVLYFYPNDDTPGCTAEACAFRDLEAEFAARGARILGVSANTLKSHEKFAAKYRLGFPLLSDPGGTVASQYGAWGEKVFMGRRSIGMLRTTYVIGRDGRIAAVFPKVKVDGHAPEVLQAVAALA